MPIKCYLSVNFQPSVKICQFIFFVFLPHQLGEIVFHSIAFPFNFYLRSLFSFCVDCATLPSNLPSHPLASLHRIILGYASAHGVCSDCFGCLGCFGCSCWCPCFCHRSCKRRKRQRFSMAEYRARHVSGPGILPLHLTSIGSCNQLFLQRNLQHYKHTLMHRVSKC